MQGRTVFIDGKGTIRFVRIVERMFYSEDANKA
jgi:hypothetical protein